MTIIESERTALRQRLVDVLGPQEAKTLMQQLPTSAWDSMATKDDLADALKDVVTKDDLKGFATKDDFMELVHMVAKLQFSVTELSIVVHKAAGKNMNTVGMMLGGFAITIVAAVIVVLVSVG